MQKWSGLRSAAISALQKKFTLPLSTHRFLHSSTQESLLLCRNISIYKSNFNLIFSTAIPTQLQHVNLGFPTSSSHCFMMNQTRHASSKERKRTKVTPVTSKLKKTKMKSYSSFKSRFRTMNDGQIRRWRAGKRHNAHLKGNHCLKPERFVVFKNGDTVKKVGSWISSLLKACLGGELHIDSLESYGTACFEKAVIFRRGLGKMSTEKRHELFGLLRCRAWRFCNVSEIGGQENGGLRISLVGREGKRSFKNESGVREVMEKECEKVSGCRLKLVHIGNMSFCDQVKLMATTDVLASTHGAQLTNMMFMRKGSNVMEMFPKGWLEGAGIGQYIYHWFASWSEMNHEGSWRDTSGPDCVESKLHPSKCFLLQKDWPVGLNETYLASWTNRVIKNIIKTRSMGLNTSPSKFKACSCVN